MDIGKIIGRERGIIQHDIDRYAHEINEAIAGSRVLIYGGAGSIGKELAFQIFKRHPSALHVMDINENDLVELVRNLRSSLGHIAGETGFLPIDMGSVEALAFLKEQQPYDYVLNLAAVKHVRSEKDPYSLMRMINVNVLNTNSTLLSARASNTKKYFAVSTDKATNPVNLMGATKRIMEDVLFASRSGTVVSTARFANVAFSNGSLLHGFRQRLSLRQPLAAPRDVKRYFVTGEEAGLLCLASVVLGQQREILFPKLDSTSDMATFSDIAVRFLEASGYEAIEVASEEDARDQAVALISQGKWPCYFFDSDTAGEKPFEEFYAENDNVDWARFSDIGIIKACDINATSEARIATFLDSIASVRARGVWTKGELVEAIKKGCPDLCHADSNKSLDEKM